MQQQSPKFSYKGFNNDHLTSQCPRILQEVPVYFLHVTEAHDHCNTELVVWIHLIQSLAT